MPKNRPFGVTLLLWMVLILSAWGAVRFFAALRWWNVLNEFGAKLSPLYLSVTGAVWSVAGGVLLISILRQKGWARLAVVASILVWLIEYWVERIFFEASRANIPFALTLSILGIATTWTLTVLPGTKFYFVKSEEHEQSIEESDVE